MARELDGYRENMELLNNRYPDHDMLTMEEVKEVTGYRSKDTVLKHLGSKFAGNRLSKVYLARFMCG